MRPLVFVLAWVLLTITTCHVTLAGEDKNNPAEAPKEQSVVDYDSQTHGAVQVKSTSEKPRDSFNVVPEGKRDFMGPPELLNSTRELAPGTYEIDVNRTRVKVKVEVGKKTILLTGDLAVESNREGAFWVPKQGKETRLASNPPVVNRHVALFPGTDDVYINVGAGLALKSLGRAEVKAGKKTVVKE